VYDNATSLPVITPKSYGKSIKPSDLPDGISRFFPIGQAPSSSSGLPKQTLLPILHAIREDVADIREVFTTLEIRMVGGSLFIVYEADWARAEDGLQRLWLDEGDEEGEEEDEEDEDEDDDDDDRPGPPFVVKIIDFAHTRLAPGEGADEGALLGIDTVLRLLDARIAQIEGLKF
jgi:1D-myo-inositol-tetrakisphosphate 5-kinase/inositol-polyphosphate multikinase